MGGGLAKVHMSCIHFGVFRMVCGNSSTPTLWCDLFLTIASALKRWGTTSQKRTKPWAMSVRNSRTNKRKFRTLLQILTHLEYRKRGERKRPIDSNSATHGQSLRGFMAGCI